MRLLVALTIFLASPDPVILDSKLPITKKTDFFSIRPGVSHREDVLRIFKQPTRTEMVGGKEILFYVGAQQIDSMKETRFTIDPATHRVERVVGFLMSELHRYGVENTFGRECPRDAKPGSKCYVVKPRPDQRLYLEYEWQGIAFLFDKAGLVEQVIFMPVKGDLLSSLIQ